MTKRPRILIFTVLFSCGLAVGIWLGHSFGTSLRPPGSIQSAALPSTPPHNQRRLLVIGVDRAGSTKARLQAVWHITYLPQKALASFISLYPLDPDQRRPDSRLEETFRLRSNGEPDPAFLDTLREVYNLEQWHGLVLVDDIAMMQVVDFLGGVQEGTKTHSGLEVVGAIPPAWVDRRGAQAGQQELIRKLCNQISFEKSSRNYNELLNLMPAHLDAYGIEPTKAIQDWLDMISTEGPLKCEFPMLSAGDT